MNKTTLLTVAAALAASWCFANPAALRTVVGPMAPMLSSNASRGSILKLAALILRCRRSDLLARAWEMVEAVLGATGVVVVLRMVAVTAVLGMLIGEGSRTGELRDFIPSAWW